METGHVRAVEAVIETKAAITVLQAEQAVAHAAADDADRGLEAIRRIRAALPALHLLWERFPGLPPEGKFTAAGMTLAHVGLVDGDLEILASIPHGTTSASGLVWAEFHAWLAASGGSPGSPPKLTSVASPCRRRLPRRPAGP